MLLVPFIIHYRGRDRDKIEFCEDLTTEVKAPNIGAFYLFIFLKR